MNHRSGHPLLTLRTPLLILFLLLGAATTAAQEPRTQTQELTGRLEAGEVHVYLLRNLQAGETLAISMTATSGDLDPIMAVADDAVNLDDALAQYRQESLNLLSSSDSLAADVAALQNRYFLALDDDGGQGYAAALDFTVPADGDYRLLAAPALALLGRATSGDYALVIERRPPPGQEEPAGNLRVERQQFTAGRTPAVSEASGSITAEQPVVTLRLAEVRAGETLYVHVAPTAATLIPAVILRDFGGKPLEAANLGGGAGEASLSYIFPVDATGYTLDILAAGATATGDFRALVGLDTPEVLTGEAVPAGRAVIQEPLEVQIGIKLERISEVDSQNETFTMLGSMRLDWQDPALAFSPDTCNCSVKLYTDDETARFLADVQSRWPDFVFANQLGNRWVQSRGAAIWPDGRARYGESFSTTFQADFDFRQYPLDNQEFPIYVDLLLPASSYTLAELPGYSAISSEHGEDEFVLSDLTTTFSSVEGRVADAPVSRFTFSFSGPRHLDYYVLQVFVPILLIILISWFTFFLRDYSRRIEVAAGNILLFIAFSFSLADNYPRLGYVTFLDAIMAVTFAVNTLVLLYNVYMKNLESRGEEERVERIDRFFDWAYPLSYVLFFGIVWFYFF